MNRGRRASIVVEVLESKVVLSGIASAIAFQHHALVAVVTHFQGSMAGTYVKSPNTAAAGTIQLSGGGTLGPLGAVSVIGTITSTGGQLTLHCPSKNVTETVVLSAPHMGTPGPDLVETFSYRTTDGEYAGTFSITLQSGPGPGATATQNGTFSAQFS